MGRRVDSVNFAVLVQKGAQFFEVIFLEFWFQCIVPSRAHIGQSWIRCRKCFLGYHIWIGLKFVRLLSFGLTTFVFCWSLSWNFFEEIGDTRLSHVQAVPGMQNPHVTVKKKGKNTMLLKARKTFNLSRCRACYKIYWGHIFLKVIRIYAKEIWKTNFRLNINNSNYNDFIFRRIRP